MTTSKREAALWQAVGLVALVVLLQMYLAGDRLAELSYGDFKTLLTAGTLSDVTVGSGTIEGTVDLGGAQGLLPAEVYESLKRKGDRQDRDGHARVKVRRVDDPQLTAQLDASGVRYTAAAESRWLMVLLSWVVPAQRIDEEIARLVEGAHERVARTLLENRAVLEAIARRLVEQEVFDRAALDAIVQAARESAASGEARGAPAPRRDLSGATATN
jgi:ATP-dependent Zn protease